jgi:hypothetical protein
MNEMVIALVTLLLTLGVTGIILGWLMKIHNWYKGE